MGAAFARVRVPPKDKGDVLRAGVLMSPQPASSVGSPAATPKLRSRHVGREAEMWGSSQHTRVRGGRAESAPVRSPPSYTHCDAHGTCRI